MEALELTALQGEGRLEEARTIRNLNCGLQLEYPACRTRFVFVFAPMLLSRHQITEIKKIAAYGPIVYTS